MPLRSVDPGASRAGPMPDSVSVALLPSTGSTSMPPAIAKDAGVDAARRR